MTGHGCLQPTDVCSLGGRPDGRMASRCAWPCSPCDGCRKPLHTSAGALIPILMSLRVMWATSPSMSGTARVGVEARSGCRATALCYGTCGRTRNKCPECAGPARQQLPCSPVHTPLTAQRGVSAKIVWIAVTRALMAWISNEACALRPRPCSNHRRRSWPRRLRWHSRQRIQMLCCLWKRRRQTRSHPRSSVSDTRRLMIPQRRPVLTAAMSATSLTRVAFRLREATHRHRMSSSSRGAPRPLRMGAGVSVGSCLRRDAALASGVGGDDPP